MARRQPKKIDSRIVTALLVLAVGLIAGGSTYLASDSNDSVYEVEVRYETLPGSTLGVRALVDHYVEQFRSLESLPSDLALPAGAITIRAETGDLWDQFFTIKTQASSADAANETSQLIAAWIASDSERMAEVPHQRDLDTWLPEAASADSDLAVAQERLDAEPSDGDLAFERNTLRNRLTGLEGRIADSQARVDAIGSFVEVTRFSSPSQGDSAARNGWFGLLTGLLIGSAFAVAIRPAGLDR